MKQRINVRLTTYGTPFRFTLDFFSRTLFQELCTQKYDGNKSKTGREIIKMFTGCATSEELYEWCQEMGISTQRVFEYSLLVACSEEGFLTLPRKEMLDQFICQMHNL